MWNRIRHFFRPVLAILAKPGIGLPHGHYEAELMAAGAKPVAIMSDSMISPEMRTAINEGRIVKVGTNGVTRIERIYYRPEIDTDMQQAAAVLQKNISRDRPCDIMKTREVAIKFHRWLGMPETPLSASFYRAGIPDFFGYASIRPLDHIIKHYDTGIRQGDTRSASALLEGRIKALPPVYYAVDGNNLHEGEPSESTIRSLDQAVERGDLACLDLCQPIVAHVFAQASKQETGEELFSRYYRNSEGYDKLDPMDAAGRVGEILGYTQEDFKWFSGQYKDEMPPNALNVLAGTEPLRRWARRQVMLIDAEKKAPSSAPAKPCGS